METNTLAGFRAHLIDRLMRSAHAEALGSTISACSIVATLFIYSDAGFDPSQVVTAPHAGLALAALFGLPFAIGGWWTVRTWRRLWRRGRSSWERVVYDYGVRMVGFAVSIGLIFTFAWLGWKSDSGEPGGFPGFGCVIAAIVFGTPIALNMGYFWGKRFAAFIGVENDPRIEVGEPPQLQ